MENEEAVKELIDKYTEANFQLVEKEPDVILQYKTRKFILSKEDINEYAEYLKNKDSYILHSTNCGIYNRNYREQLIEPLQEKYFFWFRRMLISTSIYFGVKDDDEIEIIDNRYHTKKNTSSQLKYVEIGKASNDFINHFRFTEYYLKQHIGRLRSVAIAHAETRVDEYIVNKGKTSTLISIKEGLVKPFTIKVFNINAVSDNEALEISDSIINKCLFELAYNKGLVFGISRRWTNTKERKIETFMRPEWTNRNIFPLSKIGYNPDLIKYYLLAMSTNNPILQFLAFYQVLEYFFVKVSDEELYEKLSRILKDPNFRAKEKYLNKLVITINNFNQKTDETAILKLVLKKYIDEEEFIKFIKQYENYIKEKILTKTRTRFSDTAFNVKLIKGHALNNTAIIIKEVRNALVHSSDRIERQQRYIPFSEKTEIVWELVPIVKYLAEKVIIATAEVLD